MSAYKHIQVPDGARIEATSDGTLQTPDRPIIAFIEGDGTGPDIWRASRLVFDEAVRHCYGGKRAIAWMEVFAHLRKGTRDGHETRERRRRRDRDLGGGRPLLVLVSRRWFGRGVALLDDHCAAVGNLAGEPAGLCLRRR